MLGFQRMSTLVEIESALPQLTVAELASLESFARAQRLRRVAASTRSAFDLEPLRLGQVLKPLGAEDDILGEMLDEARD